MDNKMLEGARTNIIGLGKTAIVPMLEAQGLVDALKVINCDDICLSVAVTGENGCKYDSTNKKCIESAKCKTFTSVSDGKTCTNLPTTNTVTLKCVFNTNKCDEGAKKCSEITFGGTDEICSKAVVSDDNKFKCAAENDKCKEVAKDASSSSKNSTKSSTSSKSEEKNGANYAKLSLGLLGLLFF